MEDITNKKFNRLTAIKPLFRHRREWVWKCLCDCGNETNVRISKLKNSSTKSCGCYKKENLNGKKSGKESNQWKGYEDISESFFGRMRNSSALRKIHFDLTKEYLWEIYISQNRKCAYTGIKIDMPINVRQLRGENNENIASLDRIDNSKGCIKGNVQWVCKRVNYMKHTMSESYFLEWIKKIYEYKI